MQQTAKLHMTYIFCTAQLTVYRQFHHLQYSTIQLHNIRYDKKTTHNTSHHKCSRFWRFIDSYDLWVSTCNHCL